MNLYVVKVWAGDWDSHQLLVFASELDEAREVSHKKAGEIYPNREYRLDLAEHAIPDKATVVDECFTGI